MVEQGHKVNYTKTIYVVLCECSTTQLRLPIKGFGGSV